MSMHDCVFYYWSDEQWDSCDKFREAATPILNPKGVPGLLDWRASGTQVCCNCSSPLADAAAELYYMLSCRLIFSLPFERKAEAATAYRLQEIDTQGGLSPRHRAQRPPNMCRCQ